MDIQDIDLKDLIEKETGERFNREGFTKCPFHKEKTPSLSVKFFPDKNKQKFKCWGCEEQGDAIDFITKLKNLGYKEAREYLGMENIKTEKELQEDNIKKYIDGQLKGFKKGFKLLGIFPFVDKDNKVLYYKAKFLKPDGTKETPYYHIDSSGNVVNKRGESGEVPYNLHNTLTGIKQQKIIIFVEGEKDANTINSILRKDGYETTSVKGLKDFELLKDGMNYVIYVIGDTGAAGEKYKWFVHKNLFEVASEFRFINLPGIKSLGDNKDVTDWLESGHTKQDLLEAFERSLDLKSKDEFQQNQGGIYKYIYNEKKDIYIRTYITDFRLLEAKRISYVDDEIEYIKLTMKTSRGEIVERVGSVDVFNDIRVFKKSLNAMDLTFKSTDIKDLTELKSWINKYWATEAEEVYQGTQFIKKDDKLVLITKDGAIEQNGINETLKAESTNVDIACKELITKAELTQLKRYIFKFATPDKTIPIIGTILHNLAVIQCKEVKERLHHLLLVGESGSGKSAIMTNVIAAILNYPTQDIKSIGLITPFALTKELSTGNYPSLFEEFKPSMMGDRYKAQKISENLRNLYDRTTISRGDKSFKTKDFQLTRPIILAGEESYPNAEKALIERSAIVYLSRRERTEEHTKAMQWIIDNEEILNKFGRSIIDVVLDLSTEDYKEIRSEVKKKFKLQNRVLTTAINIATGIELFNILLEKHQASKLIGYEKHISKNINEEILDEGNDTKSVVEQMLVLYNNMINDNRAFDVDDVIKDRGDGLFIRTSEMINQIHEFCTKVGSADIIPLKARDFKKQADKSGYLVKQSSKVIKIGLKPIRFDEYSKEGFRKLGLFSIVQPDILEEPLGAEETKVIQGYFEGVKTP
ncbi:CHC2 zinc finger domain-containing protein [Clostridium cellulovorans]|uniref:Sigma 54 interacting domain protein n=1 Tax=Clostridium cellulovorans (strain ATCC 35296 / DSM 3052 / OCM 3 / 743B) TaxID=573061 RepID=D9SWE9_CLOC7|nr:CHC2 zinc finger domain-containing protein [Clostridium cellulovorans]ADL53231.1 Sigma 54 interacting domain protein [Clostridium cellulovorans 743B]